MTKATKKSTPDSHAVRRAKYSLSLAVAVIAAVGIVVFVNWISARQYLRLDLTQNRSYSLSAQSKAVLNQLDGDYRIVTLLPDEAEAPGEQAALVYGRVRDMADEYARYGDNVDTEHKHISDVADAGDLSQAIITAFEDELSPIIKAIDQGRSGMADAQTANQALLAVMMSAVNDESIPSSSPTFELFQAAATRCKQFEQTAEQTLTQADELMDQVLLNYTGVKDQLQAVLTDYDAVLGVVTNRAGQLVRSDATDNVAKERLLEIVELCKQAQAAVKTPLEQMQLAEPAPRYDRVFLDLSSGASVIVLGPGKVKIVPVSEMWRPDTQAYRDQGVSQPQYLIEEKITGALLSMTLEQPPMVVFVLSGTGAALGQQGRFNTVAQRLQSANFAVTQWNPAGQMTQMGQPAPPMPRPEAKPGQKTVWIVLPTPDQSMGNPMMMAANPRQQIADLLQERLKAGDSAMVLLAVDPASAFGVANPVTDWLATWGLTPQTDRIILKQVQLANRQTDNVGFFLIDTWPKSLPITTALSGMQGVIELASPILVGKDDKTTHYPLIELTEKRMWTHSDLSSQQAIRDAKFSEADSAESFTVGVASEQDGQRLVTVATPAWASDSIAGLGLLGPGTAEMFGARFPANSELFVNSVFWLAGLEDLIAASPRSQDVPRINDMTAQTLWWHQTALLAGMPATALLLGLGVWWTRRTA
jgi:ABC-type uncharacterized transport system